MLVIEFGEMLQTVRAIPFDAALRDARLTLAQATRQVLANGLDLLGISAPESM